MKKQKWREEKDNLKKLLKQDESVSLEDIKDDYKAEVFEIIKEKKPLEAKQIESNFSQALANMVKSK